MLPEAHIGHLTASRLRIKIPTRKGDEEFFANLEDKLTKLRDQMSVRVNPATGSVLLTAEKIDARSVASFAKKENLFQLDTTGPQPIALSQRFVQPIGELSQSVGRFTKGEVDLAGLAFLALLSAGVFQILRGQFRAPPWYTAFWYALGVFTKMAADKSDTDN